MVPIPTLIELYTAVSAWNMASLRLGHLQGAHLLLELLISETSFTDPHLVDSLQYALEQLTAQVDAQQTIYQNAHMELLRQMLVLSKDR